MSIQNGPHSAHVARVRSAIEGILGQQAAGALLNRPGGVRITDCASMAAEAAGWCDVPVPIAPASSLRTWFADSVVTAESGSPLTVFHGTKADDFTVFDIERASPSNRFGPGFYFTEDEKTLAVYGEQGRVMPVYLRITKPQEGDALTADQVEAFFGALQDKVFPNGFDATEMHAVARERALNDLDGAFATLLSTQVSFFSSADWVRGVEAMGFDGIIREVFGHKEYVVLRSEQVKSADSNNGHYDPQSPDIMHSYAQQLHWSAAGTPGAQVAPMLAEHALRQCGDAATCGLARDSDSDGYAATHTYVGARVAQAFYTPADDTIILIADRIAPGREAAVFLHEIVHKHGPAVVGEEGMRRLVGGARAWATAAIGSVERSIHDAAWSKAIADTGTAGDGRDEEFFAYAVEEAVARGVRPSLEGREGGAEQWLGDVVATLRGAVFQITNGAAPPLDAQQIVDLAYALAQLETPERGALIREQLGILSKEPVPAAMARRFSFAGPTALTADTQALGSAQEKLATGSGAAEAVRQQTGWFAGPDQKWRFEISDYEATVQPASNWGEKAGAGTLQLVDLISHPALFAAYPSLEQLPVAFGDGHGAKASLFGGEMLIDEATFPIARLSGDGKAGDRARESFLATVLHEVQHEIQTKEGFASGGTWTNAFADPRMHPGSTPQSLQIAQRLLSERITSMGTPLSVADYARSAWGSELVSAEIEAAYKQYIQDTQLAMTRPQNRAAAQKWAAYEWYRRLAGEVEARNVSARAFMTPAERLIAGPQDTADVSASDVVVLYGGDARDDAGRGCAPGDR